MKGLSLHPVGTAGILLASCLTIMVSSVLTPALPEIGNHHGRWFWPLNSADQQYHCRTEHVSQEGSQSLVLFHGDLWWSVLVFAHGFHRRG